MSNRRDKCQRNANLPCRIQIFGWYKKPSVALISSQILIFWNRPSSHRLVSAERTLATTDSSTSGSRKTRHQPTIPSFRAQKTNQINAPDKACTISGTKYSSNPRPPTHAPTCTLLSQKALLRDHSLVNEPKLETYPSPSKGINPTYHSDT